MSEVKENETNNEVIPDDYYTGNWIKVVNKKKLKRQQRLERRKLEAKEENIKRLRQKKIEERKNAKLWYDETSWQHKVLTNKLQLNDGTSLDEKYEIKELMGLYENAKNNYRKNGVCYKLMKVISKEEWENIKGNVVEK